MDRSLKSAAGFGALAGMRSASVPYFLSRTFLDGKSWKSAAVKVTTLMAAGEMVADQLPFMPSRTEPASLAGRAVSGAFAGSVVMPRTKKLIGASIGAGAAVGAAFAVSRARSAAVRRTPVPDGIYGLIEDVLVLWLGGRLVRGVFN